MKFIKKLASEYTEEGLRDGILATVLAWFVCIAAGGIYWLIVRQDGVRAFIFGVTAIAGIEIWINVVLLWNKE